MTLQASTFSELYENLFEELLLHSNRSSPRGANIFELQNASLVLTNPLSCLYHNGRRSSQLKYIYAEHIWYLMGDSSTKFISKFAKFWNSIKNPDGTVNSAYGNLIFKEKYNGAALTQWQWAIQSLIDDKDSRQSVLHFNKPTHQFTNNKDFVCTMYGIFMIRDNKLNFTIHMRSNDVILGLPTDVPFFCMLQINMLRILKEHYPELELGTYTHTVNSLHLYERNMELVSDMLSMEFMFRPVELLPGADSVITASGAPLEIIENMYNHILYNNSISDIDTTNEFIKDMYHVLIEDSTNKS